MKEHMIDLNDLSQGHNDYSGKPIIVIVCLALNILLEIFHGLEVVNIVIEIFLHVGQGLLVIAGLIAFHWSWKERKTKNRKKPL